MRGFAHVYADADAHAFTHVYADAYAFTHVYADADAYLYKDKYCYAKFHASGSKFHDDTNKYKNRYPDVYKDSDAKFHRDPHKYTNNDADVYANGYAHAYAFNNTNMDARAAGFHAHMDADDNTYGYNNSNCYTLSLIHISEPTRPY